LTPFSLPFSLAYCRGWFLGSKEKKKALSKDLNQRHANVDWEGADLKGLKQA
jgi:hypothetical protein